MKQRHFNNLIKLSVILLLITFVIIQTVPLKAQSAQTFSFAVKKAGKGIPMILIPGLDCSGEVWNETVEHFKNHFECHILTLPGFAGQPAIQSDSILKTVAGQLAVYIKLNKLNKPVIIGHSLGGWLALQFAIMYPDLAGNIICVSSSPFLPALAMGSDITADSARKTGLLIKKSMMNQKPEMVKQNSKYMLSTMMRDSSKIAWVTEMTIASDQPTQAQVMYELFSTDLRDQLGKIKSGILALGDWAAYKAYGTTRENVLENYTAQFKLAKQVTIWIIFYIINK